MTKCPDGKWIPVQEAEIDKEYSGYKDSTQPNSQNYCTILYKGNGVGWRWKDEKCAQSNLAFLYQEFTYKDQEEWYKSQFSLDNPKAVINLQALYHDMYHVGDATHELWNAWAGVDWYEMSHRLDEEEIFLLGVAPAPYSWNAGGECVALVAETYDGQYRFWIHFGKDWVDDMREEMQEIYESIKQ